jgi:hypothetical protein
MNVIVQPAGNKGGRAHYVDTISSPVPLTKILDYAPTSMAESIRSAYPSGAAAVWGVTPGSNDVNANKWKRITSGDVALFAQDKMIRSSAIVTHKFRSEALALSLWGRDDKDETWEYVYLLDDLRELAITDELFNEVAGYQPNARRQGFNVLSPELSQRIIEHFDLFSDAQVEQATMEELVAEIEREFDPEGSLDRKSSGSVRVEQGFHRNRLLGRRAKGTCDICGHELPRQLLWAAHIKKRQHCTREERLDPNVVMLACKLGCDALYEDGYITVKDGLVSAGRPLGDATALRERVEALSGRKCTAWSKESEPYFQWHRQKARGASR